MAIDDAGDYENAAIKSLIDDNRVKLGDILKDLFLSLPDY